MIDNEKCTLIIDEMKQLYAEYIEAQKNIYIKKEEKFSIFCDELQGLYDMEREDIFNSYVSPFIGKYPFIEETSSLQIIEKLQHENYHSLFLKYILDSKNPFGHEILKDFLNNVTDNRNWFESVSMRTYNVSVEVPTKGLRNGDDKKRIDIFLVDDNNKWCIVIENKINSAVHYNNKRSQLHFYRKFCEQKAYGEYNKLCILLSHNPRNYSHIMDSWIYADYYKVFKSLLNHYYKDSLIVDYLKTLFKLLFPNEKMHSYETGSMYRSMKFYQNIILKIK